MKPILRNVLIPLLLIQFFNSCDNKKVNIKQEVSIQQEKILGTFTLGEKMDYKVFDTSSLFKKVPKNYGNDYVYSLSDNIACKVGELRTNKSYSLLESLTLQFKNVNSVSDFTVFENDIDDLIDLYRSKYGKETYQYLATDSENIGRLNFRLFLDNPWDTSIQKNFNPVKYFIWKQKNQTIQLWEKYDNGSLNGSKIFKCGVDYVIDSIYLNKCIQKYKEANFKKNKDVI